jgi:hypothetical protein
MGRQNHKAAFAKAIEALTTLNQIQKLILLERFIPLMNEYECRCFYFAVLFHTMRFIITVGSLIVPALLSIQYSAPGQVGGASEFSYQIYWVTWVISLLVTISNGILTLFKIEKKYYLLHTNVEHIRSEAWQFIGLSGRYSGFHTPSEKPTHTNQFLFFCHSLEKIKMKQVEEEYFKINENSPSATQTKPQTSEPDKAQLIPDGLVPPTPLNHVLKQLLTNIGQPVDGTSQQTEVSVRPSLPQATSSKESLLQSTPSEMPPKESIIRMGAEIPTSPLGERSQNSENT